MNNIDTNIIDNNVSNYILNKKSKDTILHIDKICDNSNSQIHFIKYNNNQNKLVRNAHISFALNSDFDGGIYNFPYFEVSVKLNKGDVIIFPSYWTHEYNESYIELQKYKYTLSTWSCNTI
jgi:hypothetical protein